MRRGEGCEQRIREFARGELAALQSGAARGIIIEIDKAELERTVAEALKSIEEKS